MSIGDSKVHGTRASYRRGCRCVFCRAANADYERARVTQGTDLVAGDDVHRHLARLRKSGMGPASISRLSGVSVSLVNRLVSRQGTNVSYRMRPETAAALLAVEPNSAQDGDLVSATGSRRRLQALACNGWSDKEIATRLRWPVRKVRRVKLGLTPRVRAASARQAIGLYAQLSPLAGPSITSALEARALGWADPASWLGCSMDNEGARPISEARPGVSGLAL